MSIYNLLGAKIITLGKVNLAAGGRYQFNWNGKNDRNEVAAAGIYLIQLKTDDLNERRKVILLK